MTSCELLNLPTVFFPPRSLITSRMIQWIEVTVFMRLFISHSIICTQLSTQHSNCAISNIITQHPAPIPCPATPPHPINIRCFPNMLCSIQSPTTTKKKRTRTQRNSPLSKLPNPPQATQRNKYQKQICPLKWKKKTIRRIRNSFVMQNSKTKTKNQGPEDTYQAKWRDKREACKMNRRSGSLVITGGEEQVVQVI